MGGREGPGMGPPNGTGTSPVNSQGWWGIPTVKEWGPYISILGMRVWGDRR